jgi:hypothetical protein
MGSSEIRYRFRAKRKRFSVPARPGGFDHIPNGRTNRQSVERAAGVSASTTYSLPRTRREASLHQVQLRPPRPESSAQSGSGAATIIRSAYHTTETYNGKTVLTVLLCETTANS